MAAVGRPDEPERRDIPKDRERDDGPKGARWPPSCVRAPANFATRAVVIAITAIPIPSKSSCVRSRGVPPGPRSMWALPMLPCSSPSSTLRRFTGDEYSSSSELDAIFDRNAMHRATHSAPSSAVPRGRLGRSACSPTLLKFVSSVARPFALISRFGSEFGLRIAPLAGDKCQTASAPFTWLLLLVVSWL